MANNDTVNVIKELYECLCETECFHEKLACDYLWLSLDGLKRQHRYKALCYHMKQYELENISTMLGIKMPDIDYKKMDSYNNIYNGDRINSSDENTIKNTVKSGYETWLKIEQENLEFYNEIWKSLLLDKKTSKDTALGCFVKCLLNDAQCKIKYLTRKIMNYRAINYNPLFIIGEQKCLHKKYKKKISKVGKQK